MTDAAPGTSPALLALGFGLAAALLGWSMGWYPPRDESVAASEIRVIPSRQPVFQGKLPDEGLEGELAVRPGGFRWRVTADQGTKAFKTTLPGRLGPGTYGLYIDDALIWQFLVPQDAPVVPDQDQPVSPLTPAD